MERFNLSANPWGNFEWLAEETRKHMQIRQKTASEREKFGSNKST